MNGGPGVPKTYLYGVKREGLEFDSPLQEWIPITVDSTGELRTLPVVFNAFGDEQFPVVNRLRGNENPLILSLTARTATVNSSLFTNVNAKGAHFIVNVTALAATPSIVIKIQGREPVDQSDPFTFYDLLVSSPITTTGITVLKIYPGITAIPGGATSDILPWEFRVRVEHQDADSITYSVGANLVV